jgi:hypothetical protein
MVLLLAVTMVIQLVMNQAIFVFIFLEYMVEMSMFST